MSSEPSLAKLLQQAVDAGQVVFVHAPPRLRPVLPIVPPAERDGAALAAAFSLIFKMSHNESYALASLMLHERLSREELRTVVGSRAPAPDIASVLVCALRKKLKPFNVQIQTLWGFGYALDRKARDKVFKTIAEHDKTILAARLKSETVKLPTSEDHG